MTNFAKLDKTLVKLISTKTDHKKDYLEKLPSKELAAIWKKEVFKDGEFRMWCFEFYKDYFQKKKEEKRKRKTR